MIQISWKTLFLKSEKKTLASFMFLELRFETNSAAFIPPYDNKDFFLALSILL